MLRWKKLLLSRYSKVFQKAFRAGLAPHQALPSGDQLIGAFPPRQSFELWRASFQAAIFRFLIHAIFTPHQRRVACRWWAARCRLWPRPWQVPAATQGPAPWRPCPYELILYFIPSPRGFEWERPCSALASLKNYVTWKKYHAIGHACVELRRQGETKALTGMTGETNYQILWSWSQERAGLDFLFQTFPGRLELASDVLLDLKLHAEQRQLSYLRFSLCPDEYQRSLQFLENWYKKGHYRRYGLCQSPFQDQGAGCVSFALAFAQITGKLSQEQLRYWKKTIRIPNQWLTQQGGQGLTALLKKACFSPHHLDWARRGQGHRPLIFWDPDAIHKWIKKAYHSQRYSQCSVGQALGLHL